MQMYNFFHTFALNKRIITNVAWCKLLFYLIPTLYTKNMKKIITSIAIAIILLLSVSSCQTKHCLSQVQQVQVETPTINS